jgi:hypothetical protein
MLVFTRVSVGPTIFGDIAGTAESDIYENLLARDHGTRIAA